VTDPAEFLAQLRHVMVESDVEVREQWNRSLPLGDLVGDRWERARRLGFGPGSSIYDSAIVFGDVEVGEETWIGPNTILDGSGGGLRIGAWCSISAGVHLYTHDTVRWALSGGRMPKGVGATTIADRSYVGPHAVVRSGVTIGTQCVIGAGSYVNADVADRTIVAGSPARVIGTVSEDGSRLDISS